MTQQFFERPILNAPYSHPARHWELDHGQPTNRILDTRRRSELITPVPQPKKRRQGRGRKEMVFDGGTGLSTEDQQYNPTPIINEMYVACTRARDRLLVTGVAPASEFLADITGSVAESGPRVAGSEVAW